VRLLLAPTLGAVLGILVAAAPAAAQTADIVLEGGKITDGSGALAFTGDVAISGDRIIFVGADYRGTSKEAVDASGMVVAPGFIDAHNHSYLALVDPEKGANEPYIRQGVTTIVGGPDGFASPKLIREYIAAYEAGGIGTNVAFYVGHNAIRREVVGLEHRGATRDEILRMKALVREGMELGAVGLSTGLMYEPGMWSDTDEVVALAREAAAHGGIYDSHVRNPVFDLIKSDAEAIEIGRRAGTGAKLGHLKVVGLHNRGIVGQVISLVNAARSSGQKVVADQYPYDGAATTYLHNIILMPEELEAELEELTANRSAREADSARMAFIRARLNDRALLPQLRALSENGRDGGFSWIKAVGYTSIRIVHSEDFPELAGVHLSELAGKNAVSGFETLTDLVRRAEHPILATLGSIAEADVQALLVQPWTMISSDGAWLAESETPNGGHPRSTGSFPRVLGRYVRELGLLDLPTAIHKMTALPAGFLGLHDRGLLAEGMKADIVIFDEATITDRSTWANPTLYATGVRDVLVNGVWVLKDGKLTAHRPGQFVKRQTRRRGVN
jgi:N-acyl-D-aspartate/D-glutamate deacylase